MLQVYRSNRMESLVEALAAALDQAPLGDPMSPELVVVPSRGMERWLTQRLAQRLGAGRAADAAAEPSGGVCANVRYPFPAAVVRLVLASCLGVDPEAPDPWAPNRLVWSLLELLPRHLARAEREDSPLKDYLGRADEPVDRRQYALAYRLAELFDRYALYRPTMALAWTGGEPAGPRAKGLLEPAHRWQPRLWKALAEQVSAPTLAARFARAIELLRTGLPDGHRPFERVSFFGLSALPPAYLALLSALSASAAVSLYLLCPSHRYWGLVREKRETLGSTAEPVDPAALALDHGNPLLDSLGRLGRDFQCVLEGQHADGYDDGGDELFVDPAAAAARHGREPTMLELVQSDILQLRHRSASNSSNDERRPAAARVAPSDRSIQVHVCHGLTRQVEVLREAILHLLDADPTLGPGDVLVMSPCIEAFAPVVSAVFSDGRGEPTSGRAVGRDGRWGVAGAPRIPFHLADRSLRDQNPVAAALMKVLELAEGRVEASAVVDLLGVEPVRRRFDLRAADLPPIQSWVRQSGIRWGIDGPHRATHEQPPDSANTWRFGLDRLMLGVAMADEDDRSFADIVPFDDMEGDSVELLGRFAELCEVLFAELGRLRAPRPIAAWTEDLSATVDALTQTTDESAWLTAQVRTVLDELGEQARLQGAASGEERRFDRPVEPEVVRALLDGALSTGRGAVGYPTGALTFCALAPMRSIPHRVVCLLGMDDESFPRNPSAPAFDWMASQPQIGDRNARDEDRFLFLEALLAARDHLIITYAGRDEHRNDPRPAAVPVIELLDAIDASFLPADGQERARERVVREHPLQAFSPRSFAADEPWSYDRRLLEGARCLLGPRPEAPPFFEAPLPEPEAAPSAAPVLELGELTAFVEHPTRYLLRHGLGLFLEEEVAGLADREPVELDRLEQWRIGQDLLTARLEGRDEAAWRAAEIARGRLPLGTPGACRLEDIENAVDALLKQARAAQQDEPRELAIDLDLEACRLVGTVGAVYGPRQVALRIGAIRPQDQLGAWLRLLALCAAEPETAFETIAAGVSSSGQPDLQVFGPFDGEPAERCQRARAHLEALVRLYRRGQREPLPLFAQTSHVYATALRKDPADLRAARSRARGRWQQEMGPVKPERDDRYLAQVYGAKCPFETMADGSDFAELAVALWRPLLAAQQPARRSRRTTR